ncbi:HAMP domain-containing histidine kinase [Roseomonas sp. NAR14]|uniref:histidine kinase n=1 Tax=Roseomonas acroporae TaxID=2937791 RepID=A0A9X1Y6H9_9PROT|nr:HAMP domain-containing sensor histidine kinase [Roseomonas acroporae]MCK8782957.1 HAMP domain-containing histidine kinase [Roseomonas acroporae]
MSGGAPPPMDGTSPRRPPADPPSPAGTEPAAPGAGGRASPLLPRSFALRVALASAAAVFLVCLLGFGLATLRAQIRLESRLRDHADSSLQQELASYMPPTLKQALGQAELVDEVARHNVNPKLLFRAALWTAEGALLLGPLPGAATGFTDCRSLLPAGGPPLRACGLAFPAIEGRPRPLILVAAMEVTRIEDDPLWPLTLLLLGLAAAPAAAGVGFAYSRRLERRLAAVTGEARAVMAGDLARRLPLQGTGDEIDRLVGTVNVMLARIEALVRDLREVTDNIAHDLRSPLARTRQMLEAALRRARDPEADSATLARAVAETDAVLATFAALLRIARVEAGLRQAPPRAVALSALVGFLGETYEAVAEERDRVLALDVAPGITVPGDTALLREAVTNLLENALLHGGRRLCLSLSRDAAGGAVLAMRDDGPGIPAGERAKVLQRFYRLDRSRNTPGTGLGLALVAATARLHGASLTLGDAGPGLVVTLRFPAAG